MSILGNFRYAAGLCAAMAMVVGCASPGGDTTAPSVGGAASFLTHSRTFQYTGEKQIFRVPRSVTQIRVIGRGGKGGGTTGAYGGRVSALIPVTPGDRLVVYVAGDASGANGGFNGGASGGYGSYCRNCPGYGGGGASDVRMGGGRLRNRVLVVGGGGGAGGYNPYGSSPSGAGGKGGGLTGGTGGGSYYECSGAGGGGGTQSGGGAGGAGGFCITGRGHPGANGALGVGGSGGGGGYGASAGGGGGGGGYYGGGGGGAAAEYTDFGQGSGGGGGGGSSYIEASATDVHLWQGWKTKAPNGLIVFSW